MEVVASTLPSSSLKLKPNLTPQVFVTRSHLCNTTGKPTSPSLLYIGHIYGDTSKPYRSKLPNSTGFFSVKAYVDNPNSISSFASKVIGSLPVVGLIARILSDEGGVGGEIIDFAEFRRRVGKKCTVTDSRAFYEFQERRGRAGDPLYVLMCCYVAAVGAGLLKSEEILEGAARLRVSNDIEFEEQNFIALMNEAKERRAKIKADTQVIPMENRVEKALEAIYICCFGRDPMEEQDENLLNVMLKAVFPSVEKSEIQRIIKEKAQKVAAGGDDGRFPEPRPLSKEAVKMQMKDLEFLQQNRDN
ncbi:photosystem I assembly factor PSA3, chloroplastic [Argentina anserina]|uniref:photosystem I assembly factor PSA3, chloroplastic n=1 Tax=Argentina anserina TaxID=57926 RepID=UPI0021766D90|nr:photosystem I assembly factor PSA3, chloroplastic [Potentilla anserina]